MKQIEKLVIVLTLLISVGCSSSKNASIVNASGELSEEDKFSFTYNFFEGNKFFLNGEFEKATAAFMNCLKIDSTSAASYYKLASIYLYSKDFQLAENYAIRAVSFNNENVWYKYLLGNLYSNNKKFEESVSVFEELIKQEPTKLEFYLSLADVQVKGNLLKDGLKTLKTIEETFGVSEMITLERHKIYIYQKKYKEALNELVKLSDAFPKELRYKRLIGEFYFKSSQIDKAIETYLSIIKLNENDGLSRMGLAECYFKTNKIKEGINQLKLAFKSNEVDSEVKIGLLVGLMQQMQNNPNLEANVYELTEILLKQYPDNPDINTIYADFLLRNNLLKEARTHLRKVIKKRKDKYLIWEQLLLIENEFQDWTALYNESNEALEYFPNQSFLYFFNGFSAFQLNKYNEAIKSLEFGLKITKKDDVLIKDYYTFLAESYHKIGNKKEAYKVFDDLLKDDSENIMVLNNYAYYLSLDKENLKKAEEMSFKTIEKEPNNPTYLDTYAWILFQKKEYVRALEYIEKAIKFDLNPSSVVIEHYGDILYHNNKVIEAIVQWKKASELDKSNEILNEKIKQEKFIE